MSSCSASRQGPNPWQVGALRNVSLGKSGNVVWTRRALHESREEQEDWARGDVKTNHRAD